MQRVRLTQRVARSRKADSETPATAIDLGKNRTYHKIDEYHTFEPSLNHYEPDMRHEWKDNPREETGHGIPKTAKVYLSAKKAAKLAMELLGKGADEKQIEEQAKSFMRMGDKALTASLNRLAECKGECCEETTAGEEAPVAEEVKVEETTTAEEAPAAEAPVVEEVKVEEATASEEEAPAVEEVKVEETTAGEEEAPAVEASEEVEADEDEDLQAIEISFEDEGEAEEADSSKELQACFASEEETVQDVTTPAATTRKAGIKKLAGQPTLVRVASKKADELSALWDSWNNPDVR